MRELLDKLIKEGEGSFKGQVQINLTPFAGEISETELDGVYVVETVGKTQAGRDMLLSVYFTPEVVQCVMMERQPPRIQMAPADFRP